MANTDLSSVTVTQLENIDDYSVNTQSLDLSESKNITWVNTKWSEYLGYYKQIPELKKAIDALGMWTVGKGWTASNETTNQLNKWIGWGEDSFQSIMWNLFVVKKINGDSFAEIIRNDKGTITNLKPLSPDRIKIVLNEKGLITGYEELNKHNKTQRKFEPNQIFHLSNDRVGAEIHGVSVVEACKWVIDARNESMSDWRRLLHRSTIRVIEVDVDNTAKIIDLRDQYKEAIASGEVLIVPKDNVSFPDAPINFIDPQNWIRYLENQFYQAVGVPKIILGGSQEFTEASSKIGYLTFEQVYMSEQRELESDLWNQLAIKIKFERPVSLKNEVQQSESKNTGQTSFQPTETIPGRNE